MTSYNKQTEDSPSVKELLELSTLYHRLISDIANAWNMSITPDMRQRAFQLVRELGDHVKVKTLAEVVLKEVQPRDNQQ